jgi:hypothetical protein
VAPDDRADNGSQDLAQVVDPQALHGSAGARGRLRIAVPPTWGPGDELSIVAPPRVVCARCDGGGCDGCNRSGALRTPDDPSARELRVQLPPLGESGAAVRLVRPFGDACELEQLIVELSPAPAGAEPPAGVTRHARPAAPLAVTSPPTWMAAAGGLAALAAAAAAIVASC